MMTKEKFDAIKARASATSEHVIGADVVIICVRNNVPIDPDELGPENAARFKARAEGIAAASRDRRDLLTWIEADFEIEWQEN